MKKSTAVLCLTLFGTVATPAVAQASQPTKSHVREYTHDYRIVAAKFGARTPGRNILRDGVGARHRQASDAQIVASIAVLDRMLAPPPVITAAPAVTATPAAVTAAPAAASVATATPVQVAPAPVSSSLEACIISRESGGNPQAVNGQYEGLAQMSQTVWQEYGGGQYSSTPLGASASEQESVLSHALASGGASAWTPYDGC